MCLMLSRRRKEMSLLHGSTSAFEVSTAAFLSLAKPKTASQRLQESANAAARHHLVPVEKEIVPPVTNSVIYVAKAISSLSQNRKTQAELQPQAHVSASPAVREAVDGEYSTTVERDLAEFRRVLATATSSRLKFVLETEIKTMEEDLRRIAPPKLQSNEVTKTAAEEEKEKELQRQLQVKNEDVALMQQRAFQLERQIQLEEDRLISPVTLGINMRTGDPQYDDRDVEACKLHNAPHCARIRFLNLELESLTKTLRLMRR